jgi:LysR family hydrogen peroxide-inducible transcriptional activator
VVPELHRRHPDLRLYVREALPTQLESALLAGEHDALLVPLPVPTGVTENIPLYREPLLVGMGADHPLAAKQKIDKEDLVGREVLALEPGHRLFEQVRHLCMDYGAKLRLDYEGTSLDTLRLMLGMGMGISFLPALYVASELAKDPACVARPMSGASPQRLIGLVWRKTSSRLTAIEALADTMRHVVVRAEIPGVEATGGRKAEEPEAAALEN